MGVFCRKVGNVFFVKKWTFPQQTVHYVQYQYFFLFFYILLITGGCVRTQRTPPPDYGPTFNENASSNERVQSKEVIYSMLERA